MGLLATLDETNLSASVSLTNHAKAMVKLGSFLKFVAGHQLTPSNDFDLLPVVVGNERDVIYCTLVGAIDAARVTKEINHTAGKKRINV
jgi:hypothetical protein